MMQHYKICRIKCKRCGQVIEHYNRTKNDSYHTLLYCQCGLVALDPSAFMYRVLAFPPATLEDIEDTSVEWEDDSNV